MERRRFLQWAAAAIAAGTVFDPERLLWVPGAKTFFLPDRTIVQAETMVEALRLGLVARVPSDYGSWLDLELQVSSEAQLAAEIAAIRKMGGYIVSGQRFTEVRDSPTGWEPAGGGGGPVLSGDPPPPRGRPRRGRP